MNDGSTHKFWVCQSDDDTFLAASTESPRFCFAGATEEEVIDKANRALDAYFGNEFLTVVKEQRKSKLLYKLRPIRVENYTTKDFAIA